MALITNAEIWFPRLDPKHPNDKFDKKNPSWEVQIRTTDPAQKAEWESQNIKLKLDKYPVGHKNEAGEDIGEEIRYTPEGKKLWKAVLRKKSFKSKDDVIGEPNEPPVVIDGELAPVDPLTIGNGSIANIRVFQYPGKPNPDGSEKTSSMLMGVQLVHHIVYTPAPKEDEFQPVKTVREMAKTEDSNKSDSSTNTSTNTSPVDTKDDTAF